jgi:hypothetical protein
MIHRYVRGRVKVSAEPMECQASIIADAIPLSCHSTILHWLSVILESGIVDAVSGIVDWLMRYS